MVTEVLSKLSTLTIVDKRESFLSLEEKKSSTLLPELRVNSSVVQLLARLSEIDLEES